MATKPAIPALSYIAGDDPESIAANERYQKAMQKLAETLESRRKPLFDPMFLALARGASMPTRTGGWGEALGNVASELGKAQVEQQGVEAELANLQMQMAGQQIEMQREKQRQREFAPLLTPVGGAPAGGLGAAPAGGLTQVAGGAPDTSSGPDKIGGLTRAQFLANAARIPGMTATKALAEWNKMAIDAFKVTEGGRTNLLTNEFEPFASSDMTPFRLEGSVARDFGFNAEGKPTMVEVPKDVAIRANQALRAGDRAAYTRILRPHLLGFDSATPEQTAGAGQAAEGRPPGTQAGRVESAQEKKERETREAAEAEARKAAGVKRAELRVKETSELIEASNAARNMTPILDKMQQIIDTTPGIEKSLGVLERPDVKAQIGTLVEEALRVGNFSIGVPAIRKVLMNAGVDQSVINSIAALGQLISMTQFEQRRGLGSGTSVSNFEQQMVNQMGPTIADSKEAFMRKLKFMQEQAKFRERLGSELRKRNIEFNDFEQTADFKKMFEDYRQRQLSIVETPVGAPAGGKRRVVIER